MRKKYQIDISFLLHKELTKYSISICKKKMSMLDRQ